MWSVAVVGQWSVCELLHLREDTGLGIRRWDASSTTCHRGGITRNIYKQIREQPVMKKGQMTQEREVAPQEHKRVELLVKDSKLCLK